MKNLCNGTQCWGFQFLLILDLRGVSFNAAVFFGLGKDFLFKSGLGHCVEYVELNPLKKICIFAFLLSANIHCIAMHCSNAPYGYSLHLSNFICILDSSSDLIFREALSNKIRCESSILVFWKMDSDELHFWSISHLIFTACVACKIQVQNRPKMEFVEIHFSKIKCSSTGYISKRITRIFWNSTNSSF